MTMKHDRAANLEVLVHVVLEVLDGEPLPVQEDLHPSRRGGNVKRSGSLDIRYFMFMFLSSQ